MLSVDSVLLLFGHVFNCCRKETVSSMSSSAGSEKTVWVDETRLRYSFLKYPLKRATRSDDAKLTLPAAKRFFDDKFIFFRLDRAGGVNQSSLWRKICERILQ